MGAAIAVHQQPDRKEPKEVWRARRRVRLSGVRTALIASGEWPEELSRWGPIPEPNWTVDDTRWDGLFDAHSRNERLVYRLLKQIGERRLGRYSKATGREVGEFTWIVNISHAEGARLTGLHRDSFSRAVKGLARKHSIVVVNVRTRGEGKGNRDYSVYRLPHFREVLRARAEDPSIGIDANGHTWTWARSNSRRFLSPADVALWRIEALPEDENGDDVQPEAAAGQRTPSSSPHRPLKPLDEVERAISGYLPLDNFGEQVREEAQAAAARLGRTITDAEIVGLVHAIAESGPKKYPKGQSGHWELAANNCGYFLAQIEKRVKLHFRKLDDEATRAQKQRKAEAHAAEQARRERIERIRSLLLAKRPEAGDREDLVFYRKWHAEDVCEAERVIREGSG